MDAWAFLAGGFLVCYLEPLKYSCFNIHADGPGLAFGAFACGALYTGIVEKWRAALPLSALCAVLSFFSKQMFAPLPIALLVYLFLARGRGAALRYFWWLAAAGAVVTGAALIAVGPERLYHCTIWMPGHSKWSTTSRLVGFLTAARFFIRQSLPVPVLLIAAAVFLGVKGLPAKQEWRELLASRCAPLLLVGLALLPFSVAGRAKTGGDVNSLSFALFFLTCGLTVMLADVLRGSASESTRRLGIAALAGIILPLVLSEAPLAFDIPAKISQLPHTGQETARLPGPAPWGGVLSMVPVVALPGGASVPSLHVGDRRPGTGGRSSKRRRVSRVYSEQSAGDRICQRRHARTVRHGCDEIPAGIRLYSHRPGTGGMAGLRQMRIGRSYRRR